MKAAHALLILAFLAACDSPSPAFMGSETTVVVIENSRFAVHRRGDLVEVYRTSLEWLPRLSVVLTHAGQAIEQATGCPIVPGTMSGDHALIRARINCG